jgi:hypothetical protein
MSKKLNIFNSIDKEIEEVLKRLKHLQEEKKKKEKEGQH